MIDPLHNWPIIQWISAFLLVAVIWFLAELRRRKFADPKFDSSYSRESASLVLTAKGQKVMTDTQYNSKRAGTFTLASGDDVYGELTLASSKSTLYLRSKEYFDARTNSGQSITGVLHDLTKVTMIECIRLDSGSSGLENDRYHFATLFPHYVVQGEHYLDPSKELVTEVHFGLDDASTLFSDFDAFGSLIDARPLIGQVASANNPDRSPEIGENPEILYFTGKREIFSADTILGRVSASHNPSHTLGGPDGVRLENQIFVSIVFDRPKTFDSAITDTVTLLRYLELLIGRPQNLLDLFLTMKSDSERAASLQVFWSMKPGRISGNDGQIPHATDILVDAVNQPEEFSLLLKSWLDRTVCWRDARHRFAASFSDQNEYGIDRLVKSANMFDILPDSAVPLETILSEDVKRASAECRAIFKSLPHGPERDSILGALGRLTKNTLKQKIRHRGQFVLKSMANEFPELFTVTDEAVNCRNYYVHGNDPKFDYGDSSFPLAFLTDTLEFVFATSDLIESGWDIKAWSKKSSVLAHPFSRYRLDYTENLRNLKSLLE